MTASHCTFSNNKLCKTVFIMVNCSVARSDHNDTVGVNGAELRSEDVN